jgi:hypothetical protein
MGQIKAQYQSVLKNPKVNDEIFTSFLNKILECQDYSYLALCNWPYERFTPEDIEKLVKKVSTSPHNSLKYFNECPNNRLNEQLREILVDGISKDELTSKSAITYSDQKKLTASTFNKLATKVSNNLFIKKDEEGWTPGLFVAYELAIMGKTPNAKRAYLAASELLGGPYQFCKKTLFDKIKDNDKYKQRALENFSSGKRKDFEDYLNTINRSTGNLALIANEDQGGELTLAQNLEGALSETQEASETTEPYAPKDAFGVTGGVFQ